MSPPRRFGDNGGTTPDPSKGNNLLLKGGFASFLLSSPFVDYTERDGDISDTDLAKFALNMDGLSRNNFGRSQASQRVVRAEFSEFLKKYGTAYAYFHTYDKSLKEIIVPICRSDRELTGFAFQGQVFFLPCHNPKPTQLIDFVTVVAEAILDCQSKLAFEVPPWAQEFIFPYEHSLREEQQSIKDRLLEVGRSLDEYGRYKACLSQDGERLVKSVSGLLRTGFGYLLDEDDEYREDRAILGSDGKVEVLLEIKGTNKGVKREYINQADSHRERNGLPPDFPAVLIVNPHAKEARDLGEKDRPVPVEQVQHASKQQVLVVRTLDLLNLYCLKEEGKLDPATLIQLFKSESGWLKASRLGFEIARGNS